MKHINKVLIVLINLLALITLFMNNNIYKIDKVLLHISILPVILIPYFINKFIKFSEKYITFYIIFIFFAYFLGTIIGLYSKVFLYDKFVHTLSGLFTASLAIQVLKNDENINLSMFNKILFIISFSLFIASSWEFIEYFIDMIFKTDTQHVNTMGINDTMIDMLVAFVGSVVYVIFSHKKIRNI